MENIFLNPFKKDFCPKCNEKLKKVKHESSFYKEAFAACKRCKLTLTIVCKNYNTHNVPIIIKYLDFRFKIYENFELYIYKEEKEKITKILWHEEECDLKSIKDFYNYCLKIKDNLLFL
jgi:hypothetical protein